MGNRLFSLGFSPWSIKARWALDVRGVPYRYIEYVPIVTLLRLRVVTRRLRGPVTVPVLDTGDRVITDSLDIARFAADHGANGEQGDGPALFGHTAGDATAVEEWNRVSDDIMAAGRIITLRAALANPEALLESMPAAMRGVPGAAALGRTVARQLLRKYHRDGTDDELEARMASGLERLRAGLDGGDYLLGELSYADIAMAVSLQGVTPPREGFVPLGSRARETWIRPNLAREFADLLAWRDAFYDRHHPSS